MADTKKTETDSDEIERSEDEQIAEPQTQDEEVSSDTDTPVEPEEESEAEGLDETIEDAEIVDEISDEPEAAEAASDVIDEIAEDAAEPAKDIIAEVEAEAARKAETDGADMDDVADLQAMDGVEGQGPSQSDAEPSLLDNVGVAAAPLRDVEKETVVVEKRGGVAAGFLGGAIATLGLAFAAPFVVPDSMMPGGGAALKEEVAALQAQTEAQQGEIAALTTASKSGLDALTASLETVRTEAAPASGLEEATTALQALAAERDALLERIDVLERRPIDEAPDPASIAAVESYGRELAGLREDVATMMSRSEELVTQATQKSAAAMAEAEAQEKAAQDRAVRVARSQVLVDVKAALEAGTPFDEALSRLDGVEVPPALHSHATDGVPTLAELQSTFAPAARAALDASRKVSESEGLQGRLTTFLQSQSGIRSLAPRDGDSPDAILSRAEAAAVEARLADAITEISALPEAGQEPMADWVAQAARRAEAVAAAGELAATLATN